MSENNIHLFFSLKIGPEPESSTPPFRKAAQSEKLMNEVTQKKKEVKDSLSQSPMPKQFHQVDLNPKTIYLTLVFRLSKGLDRSKNLRASKRQ